MIPVPESKRQSSARPKRSSALKWGLLVIGLTLLTACASGPQPPRPAELGPVTALLGVQAAWSAQVGASSTVLTPLALADRVFVAGGAGTVAAIDAASGQELWRLNLETPLAAGVGSDGRTVAVVTLENELVAITDGRESWRARLPARVFTAPLVAGERVFVQTSDRTVLAFDAKNGARLWREERPADPLVLSQPGVLLAVGDTLVAGFSGRLLGIDPRNGALRWEVALATPRGINEIERLVDLVGPVSRVGNSVCVRAFMASVGCVDAARGTLAWSRPARGSVGLHGDERLLFTADANDRVLAWQRDSGEPVWESARLQHRNLSGPLVLGRVVVFGDNAGWVHLLSREDGSEMNRLSTDGSPILAAPVLAGNVLVVQTRNGGIYAWRPQ